MLASTTSFLEHLKWLRKAAMAARADLLVAGDSLQALVRHGGRHWALHPLFLSAGGAQASAALRDDADAFAGWLPYPRDRRWPIAEDALAFHRFASSAGLPLAQGEAAGPPVAGQRVTMWFWSGTPVCSELDRARPRDPGAPDRAAKAAVEWTALLRDAGRGLLAGVPEHLREGTLFTIEAVIRAQALAWRRRNAAGSDGAVEERSSSARDGAPDWLAQVAQGVAAIAPTDPERRRKAFRLYLQAVLARECGIRAIEDRGFQDLVDRVQETMEADARLRRAIEGAGDMLLQSAGVDARRP